MIKLALTGNQLAELYVLNAMGVPTGYEDLIENDDVSPEQYSFLVDTNQGRVLLLEYAEDLADRINDVNFENIDMIVSNYMDAAQKLLGPGTAEEHKPNSEQIASLAFEYLIENLETLQFPDFFSEKLVPRNTAWWNKNQKRFTFSMQKTLDMGPIDSNSDENVIKHENDFNIDNLEKINDKIWDFASQVEKEVGRYSSSIYWSDVIYNMWEAAMTRNDNIRGMADDFQASLASLARNQEFQDNFWRHYFNENEEDYIQDVDIDFADLYQIAREDQPDNNYFVIKDAVDELYNSIYEASQSGDRNDFLQVMAGIDHLSSLSHYGGPAFQYGDTNFGAWGSKKDDVLSLEDIMHRKFGDRFLTYVLTHDLLPEKYLKPLQQWYDERVDQEAHDAYLQSQRGENVIEEQKRLESDEYYKHPYYSEKNQWLEEHSPTFRAWTPYDGDYEDWMNLESLEQAAPHTDGIRRRSINQFVNREKSDFLDDGLDDIPIKRHRLSVASKLTSFASKLDIFAPDLSDRIDLLTKSV